MPRQVPSSLYVILIQALPYVHINNIKRILDYYKARAFMMEYDSQIRKYKIAIVNVNQQCLTTLDRFCRSDHVRAHLSRIISYYPAPGGVPSLRGVLGDYTELSGAPSSGLSDYVDMSGVPHLD